ncbi:hypothetical protein BDW22DRAFT_1362788 [Trametopsis cervina]|nr:hypothetical protein BDW22DRAFT_1362788 [Trametopsis cervina]
MPLRRRITLSSLGLDPTVWTLVPGSDFVKCTPCSARPSHEPRTMAARYARGHERSRKHRDRCESWRMAQMRRQRAADLPVPQGATAQVQQEDALPPVSMKEESRAGAAAEDSPMHDSFDPVEHHSGVVQAAATHATAQPPTETLARSAHTPPPVIGRRLRDSDDGDSESNLDKPDKKRLKTFAAQLCLDKGLPVGSLHSFAELSLAEMLIDMNAHLLAIQAQMDRREVVYLRSREFSAVLRGHLQAYMMSPDICFYLRDAADTVWDLIKDDPEAYGISTRVFRSPEKVQAIRSTISHVLTQIRSTMRVRLMQSFADDQRCERPMTISELTNSLCPPATMMEENIDERHQQRVALLRDCAKDFIACQAQKGKAGADAKSSGHEYAPNQFWVFVDDKIEEARTFCFDPRREEAEQKRLWEGFLEYALQADIKEYGN